MEVAAQSAEITVLAWSVVLLLAQVMSQAFATYDLGPKYLLGPRDENRSSRYIVAGRLARALRNLLETYPAFIALVLALVVMGRTGGLGAAGAWIWLAARVVYVPVYAAGIPVLRTLLWLVSIAGLLLMLIRFVW